jgi:hypothetical protein
VLRGGHCGWVVVVIAVGGSGVCSFNKRFIRCWEGGEVV